MQIYQELRIKTYVDGNGLSEEIDQKFKIRKNYKQCIRERMNIENSVLDYIRYKQFNWYDHVQRIDQERLPRRILEWCPPGRRRKGRPRNLWMQEVTTGMRERGNGDLEWVDREGWKRRFFTLRTER